MNVVSDFVVKFTACDTIVFGITLYITHRWIPGPAYLASMLNAIPGFTNQVTVGESIIAALVANIFAQKVAETYCASAL